MRTRRKLIGALGIFLGLLVVVAVALAPSWRNYHLRRSAVRIVEDIPYVAGAADSKHRLDLYLPRSVARPWPVVVFAHGGFWRPFDRRMFQPLTGLHGCVGVALANSGIATAVISYRQRPEAASLRDALDDVTQAVRYLIDHVADEGGDPQRVFLVGHSAGALFTALLAVEPEHLTRAGVPPGRVRGFAMLSGVYDLTRLIAFSDAGLAEQVKASATAQDLERYSPERQVRTGAVAGSAPMLLLVGGDEEPAMRAEQRSMMAALGRAGANATSAEVPGADHMDMVMHLSRPGDRALAALAQFIGQH